MTALEFQDELIEELKKILKGFKCKTPEGKEHSFNFFAQDIPIRDSDDEDDPFPYVIVRLKSGSDEGTRESPHIARVVIIIGNWDDNKDSQGYRSVMSAITRIYKRFEETPALEHAVFSGKFEWALQQDGYFPYWFGVCELEFNIPAVRRKDIYA